MTLKKTLDGLTPNQGLRLTAAIDYECQETSSTKKENVAQLLSEYQSGNFGDKAGLAS
mgnify:CR=1 FL=1